MTKYFYKSAFLSGFLEFILFLFLFSVVIFICCPIWILSLGSFSIGCFMCDVEDWVRKLFTKKVVK